MTTQVINDWKVVVGFDDSEVIKGAKRVERLMDRLAKKQASVMSGATSSSVGGSGGSTNRRPTAFGLAADRQLKLANTIDTVMRRAAKSVGKNSDEFRKLNGFAMALKTTIAGISSRSGLERLNNQIVRLRENVNSASTAMRSHKTATQSLRTSINGLAKSYLSLFAAIEGGRAFLQTGAKFDSLRASLLAASGGAQQAAKDFEFIKNLSKEMGVGLSVVADGYRQIGAAARASGVPSSEINSQFKQMTKLARAFGLTAADSSLVMLAFQQMISKGVVSSEELRRQLGERLPGAVPQAAKALGVTTLQLDKMLRSGKVLTKDFLPKFLDQMEGFVDESGAYESSLKTITAAQQRFTSALQLGVVESFDAGAKSGLVSFLERITETLTQLTPAFKIFGFVIGGALQVITTALDVLAPVLELVMIPLNALVSSFENAFNLDKPVEKISIFSNVLRFAAGIILLWVGSVQLAMGLTQKWIGSIDFLGDGVGFLSGKMKEFLDLINPSGTPVFLLPLKAVLSLATGFLSVASSIGDMITSLLQFLGIMDSVESTGPGLLSKLPGVATINSLLGNGESQDKIASVAKLGATTSGASTVTTTNEINVSVDAPNADAREVAVMVSEALDEKLRDNNASLASF
jgi:tape measure domain-containing protein